MPHGVRADNLPTRFREGETRNRRLGRPLRSLGRVRGIDEDLMARIGRAFYERDEPGTRLAEAMRMRAGSSGRVTMQQLRSALEHGIEAVDDAPPALDEFFAVVEATPEWVDWDLIAEGGRVFTRLGQNAGDVLLQLSLISGYRFGGPSDLLVATGGLTGDMTRRRLAETQKWATSLSKPEALLPPEAGRPAGEAWRLTVHVRAMHALVNSSFEPTWNTNRWGLPINQADQCATLGLFDGVLIIGCRALGVPIRRRDATALMHLWKYVGWLMGVEDDFLVDSEWERHRINYHLLLAQSGISEAGPKLAQAILVAQRERRFPRWPGFLQGVRGRYEQERLLSMLTVFLGVQSMRELRLGVRPPWAHAYLFPLNSLRYRVLGSSEWGRRRLEAWGDRKAMDLLSSYFREEHPAVGELPT